jgi:hypothetical protein
MTHACPVHRDVAVSLEQAHQAGDAIKGLLLIRSDNRWSIDSGAWSRGAVASSEHRAPDSSKRLSDRISNRPSIASPA